MWRVTVFEFECLCTEANPNNWFPKANTENRLAYFQCFTNYFDGLLAHLRVARGHLKALLHRNHRCEVVSSKAQTVTLVSRFKRQRKMLYFAAGINKYDIVFTIAKVIFSFTLTMSTRLSLFWIVKFRQQAFLTSIFAEHCTLFTQYFC